LVEAGQECRLVGLHQCVSQVVAFEGGDPGSNKANAKTGTRKVNHDVVERDIEHPAFTGPCLQRCCRKEEQDVFQQGGADENRVVRGTTLPETVQHEHLAEAMQNIAEIVWFGQVAERPQGPVWGCGMIQQAPPGPV
jgi:hypothetical protein